MQIQRNYTLIAAVAVVILAVACVGGAYAMTSEVSVENKVNADSLAADIYNRTTGDPISEPFLLSNVSTEIVENEKSPGYYGFKTTGQRCQIEDYKLKANYSSDSALKLSVWVSSDDPATILAFDRITVTVGTQPLALHSSDMTQWGNPVEMRIDSNTFYDIFIDVSLSSASLPFDSLEDAESHLDVSKLVFNFTFTKA